MDLIFTHKNGAKIYQCGYREIPRDLVRWDVDAVLYCASECPPLNDYFDRQSQATTHYFPNEDKNTRPDQPWYMYIINRAKPAAQFLYDSILKGQTAIVTCSQGINRSSLVTGMALKKLEKNWSGLDVVEHIQSRRSGALDNSCFVGMLCAPVSDL